MEGKREGNNEGKKKKRKDEGEEGNCATKLKLQQDFFYEPRRDCFFSPLLLLLLPCLRNSIKSGKFIILQYY